jgi:Tol biopolymer transport system component
MPVRLIATATFALCAALLLTSCGGSSSGRADFVFVSTRDGAYELYAMNADGSHQHRLTPDHGSSSPASRLYYQLDPAWSLDGRMIAFASHRDGPSHIFVVGADGKHTRRLTSGHHVDTHPTWSPDGRRIAFVRGTTGVIEVMNADGTHVHRFITNKGNASEGDPAWSPDGRWIAFDLKAPGGTTSDLWLVHPDGTDPHRLTPTGVNSISPAWSADSRRIAFSSDSGGSMLAIFEIGVSGHGLQLVARPDQDGIQPAWSPDGKKIAFSTNGAITTVDFAANFKQLTDPKNNDTSPIWNPVQAVKAKGY